MTTYDFIESNNRRTVLLCMLFPLIVGTACLGVSLLARKLYLATYRAPDLFLVEHWMTITYIVTSGIIIVNSIWIYIAYNNAKDYSMRSLPLIRANMNQHRLLCQTVQNMAITAGIRTPSIYIQRTNAMNAFAAGADPDDSAIIVTQGLIEKLTPAELEGVIAHEIAHILNRDTRLMMIIIYGISMYAVLSEFFFRSLRAVRGPLAFAMLALAGVFYLLQLIVFPILRFAISRNREFLADSTAALLTRNPEALAEALVTVAMDSNVPQLNNLQHSSLCIAPPGEFSSIFSSIYNTHPPVHERVEALLYMAE